MPRIKAFQALRPPAEQAESVASVPYDVVNRAEAAELAKGNPNSFLHVVRPDIDLPEDVGPYDDRVYEMAGENLKKLVDAGALRKDDQECLFLYRQIMNGQSQVGLVCCSHVDDYENNLILKHEKTRPAKEDDRTRHVLSLNAHAGPVFLTYRDHDAINKIVNEEVTKTPLYDFVAPDGVQHTAWRLTDCDELVSLMGQVPCFYVADGHHRAASAWRAAAERKANNADHNGDEEYAWFLTVLFPASELNVLAYNRVVKDLNGQDPAAFLEAVGEHCSVEETQDPVPQRPGCCCFFDGAKWFKISFPPEKVAAEDPIGSLDVALLETCILQPVLNIQDVRTDERIDFVGGIRGTAELERLVTSGKWAGAFSMYPTSIEQLMRVSDANEVMPPKSTWFEPKLRSGLFVHQLD